MIKIVRFAENRHGKDYAVGDIHGNFTQLQLELDRIGFDPKVDRLFAVGDLVDRGPESEECWDWLRKPWFFSVKGNHEQMAIDGIRGGPTSDASGNHYMNGGAWAYGLSQVEQDCYAYVLDDLPLVMEIDTPNGLVVIVHAEVPYGNYDKFKLHLRDKSEHANMEATLTWARTKAKTMNTDVVPGCYKVYCGHTPKLQGVVQLGNVNLIDQGCCFAGGSLSVVEIK